MRNGGTEVRPRLHNRFGPLVQRLNSRVAHPGGSRMGNDSSASANKCIGHVHLTRAGAW